MSPDHHAPHLLADWVCNGLLVAGAALCLVRALARRQERAAWTAMGAGVGCWAAAEIVATLDPESFGYGRFTGAGDLLWLAFYPASFVAVGLLARRRVRDLRSSLWLDGAVGAATAATLAAQFVLPPIVARADGSTATVIGDIAYPMADLLLVGFVVGVAALTSWRPGRVLGAVGGAVLLGAVANVLSLYWPATGQSAPAAIDGLWPAAALILAWAAWQPERPAPDVHEQGLRLVAFPVGFGAVALAVLAFETLRPLHAGAHVLALVTMAGVVARLALTFTENLDLVRRSRAEAMTDTLTGLPNRRALLAKLGDVLQAPAASDQWVLLLFDLNGFKRYNDTFGHPIGDALLNRLGGRLAEIARLEGCAYRLGGDEFCVLSRVARRTLEQLSLACVEALSEHGGGFDVSTAYGHVLLSSEADEASRALALADKRLYANKRARDGLGASGLVRDVLMQVMAEREPDLHAHLNEVAVMARAAGCNLGLDGEALDVVVRAAELHDLGKLAVPDALLQKPSALDGREWTIVERHSEVGERILSIASAMRPVARLIRSSHERWDGLGYPDGLAGEEIPLGARIIAVCDAFHAMTSERPYSRRMDHAAAVAELRANAGTQFDPAVVEAFLASVRGRTAQPRLTVLDGGATAPLELVPTGHDGVAAPRATSQPSPA